MRFRFKSLLSRVLSAGGRTTSGRISIRHRSGMSFMKRNWSYLSPDFLRYYYVSQLRSHRRLSCMLFLSLFNTVHLSPRIWNCNIGQWNVPIRSTRIECIKDFRTMPGNTILLKYARVGTRVCNIERHPLKGPVYARAPGCRAMVLSKKRYKKRVYVQLKLPSSGEVYLSERCHAILGRVGLVGGVIGKAGLMRHYGYRPTVRGVAMNPVDHPHGGGEGKKSNPSAPCNPWGTQSKFKKTLSRDFLRKRNRRILRLRVLAKTITI